MTKIPTEVIKLAIEGGWRESQPANIVHRGDMPNEVVLAWNGKIEHVRFNDIALDREFWIALGKALEWTEENGKVGAYNSFVDGKICDQYWMLVAHHLYDLILSDQDTTEFWASLVKDN